jgi:hypothetical protein
VSPTDGGVPTGQAGALLELRGGAGAPVEETKTLARAEKGLLGDGTTIVPGQVLVLAMPNFHDDADPKRPSVGIAGQAAVRVVALDGTGCPLADATVSEGRLEVPERTARVALLGVGLPIAPQDAGQDAATGLPGWHASARVAEVLPGTALTPGGIVRGPSTGRRRAAVVAAALATAREVVAGYGLVETTVPATARTIVVALDRGRGSDDDLNGIAIGLRALRRRTGPEGELPPRVVASGPRTVLLYPVEVDPRDEEAEPNGPPETATVSVASDERWEVAAVIASTLAPPRMAQEIASAGLEHLLAPLVPSSIGAATITWIPGGEA